MVAHAFMYGILFSLLVVLPHCGGLKAPKTLPLIQEIIQEEVYPYFDDEVRLWDIPFPIGIRPYDLSHATDERKLIIGYTTSLALYDLIAFYRTEMECLGWDDGNKRKYPVFEGTESCLAFQKPSKFCVVTFRPDQKVKENLRVTLFVGPMKALDDEA